MLTPDDLKNWLHRDLKQSDKILLVLATFDMPCQVKDIKKRASDAGLKVVAKWNVSKILGRTSGLAISTPTGWELTDTGKHYLRKLGVSTISPAAGQVAIDLRKILETITDDDTHAFAEEAIRCYELECYRSAIVMSWLAAIDVLKKEVHANHLAAFNAEAARVNAKWKTAKTTDDIGEMKEFEFLDRIARISVIGKNVKDELHKCLKTRNGCGHPNSLKIGQNAVANHLEVLLLNVFQKFC